MQDTQIEEMEGVEVTDAEKQSLPLLTEEEKRVLDVYDRLEELQLEIALLKAQGVLSQGESLLVGKIKFSKHLPTSDEPMDTSKDDIITAQQDLLKAKAAYQVRNNVIESVLMANPILKAVHGGKNVSIAEL
jgi:hypothetical protein